LKCDYAIGGRANDLKRGIFLKGMCDQAPNDHRVIHHEHANSFSGLQVSLI